MTDRELLELAAKAAGIAGKFQGKCEYYREWGIFPDDGCDHTDFWNSLTDDGDAFRLAVDCGIGMRFHDGWGEVFHPVAGHLEFKYGDDKRKATRYAITQLAAEIGKGMK